MSLPKLYYITEKAFLIAEQLATKKYEYFIGKLFAMSSANISIKIISANIVNA